VVSKMDTKKLILQTIKQKGEVKVADITSRTGFSRAYINRFFQQLREEGAIILLGKANQARYVRATEQAIAGAVGRQNNIRLNLANKDLSEEQVLKRIKQQTSIFRGLTQNVAQILDYALTEMVNNAIEHSQSKTVAVEMTKDTAQMRFAVVDTGVGIFNNIMAKRKLATDIEAVQDLVKGKQTTAPEAHSGEGIFFTSKCADVFTIKSGWKKLIFDNLQNDIFVKDNRLTTGTKVLFSIAIDSPKNLTEIFNAYTSSDTFAFDKTSVKVKLHAMETEFISRSQARRLLSGLEKFSVITLDFAGVNTMGQGFADEVFRVWQARYPDKTIVAENAGENIRLWIDRALNASG